MSRSSLRKVAVAGLGVALLGSGLTVGLGAGVASAAPGCEANAKVVLEPTIALGPLKHTYTYEKTASPAQVAAGGTITYTTTISSREGLPLVYGVTDYPQEGFGAPIEAYVSAQNILGPLIGERSKVNVIPSSDGYKVANGAGWMLESGKNLTVELTYVVPKNLKVGDEVRSKGTAVTGTLKIGTEQGASLGTCATVRPPNAGEAIADGLDSAGLGSMNTASANAFGSLLNPSGSINGIIKDLPLGDIIGNLS